MSSYRFTQFSLLLVFGSLTCAAFAQPDVLYTFPGSGNGDPSGGLVLDSEGNLYGTSTDGQGIVYQLIPRSNGSYDHLSLYQFAGATGDGLGPGMSVLIRDRKGNFFWTAPLSGTRNCGFVYELSPKGDGSWSGKAIHEFQQTSATDGCGSVAPLTIDEHGNLFGTTAGGGANGGGTVFELSPDVNGKWTESVLWSFGSGISGPSTADGYAPQAGLVLDSKGDLYGTTFAGGVANSGVEGIVFELSQQGVGSGRSPFFILLAQRAPTGASLKQG